MKKSLSVILLLALIIGIIPVQSVKAADTKDAYKAYSKWIEEKAPKGYTEFKLLHIDNDGIPELLAMYDQSGDWGIDKEFILCTFTGDKIKEKKFECCFSYSGTWFACGVSYIPKKGKLLEWDANRADGDETDVIYKLKNGKIKKWHTASIGKQSKNCKWDGKSVSKKTYDKKLKKAFNSDKAKQFDQLTGFKSKDKILKKLEG